VIFAAIVVAPAAFRRLQGPTFRIVLPLMFLLFYGAGVVVLANTAHHGGRLVHELGVQALMTPAAAPVEKEADQSLKGLRTP
jgi:ABC-type Fe3+-siderophore transport system permease subunit